MTVTGRTDFNSYCVISVWFGCNNRCDICMLSTVPDRLEGLPFERYQEVIRDLAREGRFKNLILSGGEVTTFNDLGRYARLAASLGCFEKIQIQTNGRKLADKGYLDSLIDSGINEFFVSVQGLEKGHDATTGAPGSFRETMEGIENLRSHSATVITNTVLTRANLADVPGLIHFLAGGPVHEMQVWNYFPMERTDRHNRIVPLEDVVSLFPDLVAASRHAGKPIVLKSFPHCLSAEAPVVFDSKFPATVLPDRFWRQFGECGFGQCFYRKTGQCGLKECWGLSSAYMEKYGDDRELLQPMEEKGGKDGIVE